jgi:protein gp37
MADNTGIEWTDTTWNPTTGCDRVSPGCDHCYALTLAKRLKGMGSAKYQNDGDPDTSGPGFGATEHPDSLAAPLSWRKPRKVFVNSMSDLFHKAFSDEFIARVFAVMAATPQHTYQVLTKRHARMRSLLSDRAFADSCWYACAEILSKDIDLPAEWWPGWPLPNVWLGVSVENQQWADIRIPALLDTPAAVRFLSCEPLLGPVELTRLATHTRGPVAHSDGHDQINVLTGVPRDEHWERRPGVDWVIVGGESGPGARPMHPDWARFLRDQCAAAAVPFLFKQHGEYVSYAMGGDPWGNGRSPWADRRPDAYVNERTGATMTEEQATADGGSFTGVWRVGKKAAGRELDGRTHDEYPQAPASAVDGV